MHRRQVEIDIYAIIDFTIPRLKRGLLLGTRWGQPNTPLVPLPGEPGYLNYAYTDSPLAVGVSPGAVDAVRQLHGANGREGDIDLAVRVPHAAQDVFDAFAAPLAFDQDAGIKDKTQSVSPIPTCREACGGG